MGAINAKTMCIVSYLASLAGATGVSDLGLAPDTHTGNFARHLRLRLHTDQVHEKMYWLQVPMFCKYSQRRELKWTPVLPPGELVCEDWSQTLEEFGKTGSDWAPSFLEHDVTREVGDPSKVCPYSLYVDAAPFTKPESFYGLWTEDTRTGKIYMTSILLKSDFCQCGCRGYCTVEAIQKWLVFHCYWWAKGLWPPARHDQLPWRAEDSHRAEMAGQALACFGACTELRADWPEFCFTCGFKSFSTNASPCFKCLAIPEDLHAYSDCTSESLPWGAVTHDTYMEEVRRCEIIISIPNARTRDDIARLLISDRRDDGAKGRALKSAFEEGPHLKLLAWDRLETNDNMLDPFAFEEISHFPTVIKFWRTSQESRLNRYCLLFGIPGFGFANLCVCILHCLDLGVVSKFVSTAMWTLLISNIYKLDVTNQNDLVRVGLVRLRAELWDFYRTLGNPKHTQIHDLTEGMLGSKATPMVHHASGAETRSLLPFVVHQLTKYKTELPQPLGEFQIAAGSALQEYFDVQALHGRQVPRQAVKQMLYLALRHNTLLEKCTPHFVKKCHLPKHHQWLHAILDTHWQGNPKKRSTYRNESLNGIGARIGRSVHRTTFTVSTFEKFDLLCRYAPHRMGGLCTKL